MAKTTKTTKTTKAAKAAKAAKTVIPEPVVLLKPTLATATTTDLTKPVKKLKAPVIDIVRGRMPLAMVFSIKFLETGSTSEIAAKYRTTMGKVDDIKKEANFGYIKETFKPTTDMVKAVIPRCKELVAGKEILTAINNIGVATPEDEIAFTAIKDALRKKSPKIKPIAEAPIAKAPIAKAPIAEVTDEDVNDLTEDEDLMSLIS